MSWWSRIANVVRGDRLSREIDEELESHIEEAIGRGRDPAEVRRAFGSPLRHREESRDARIVAWLDSLRADAFFGGRQLMKNKVTSAAAILSLALAIGSCMSAFRLIDALLLRPLPVANPRQLYALSRLGIGFDGKRTTHDTWAYPAFQQMREVVKDQAELLAISAALRMDLTYKSDQEMEKACVQYVSGRVFGSFGLRPSLGRLFTDNDDLKPGAHPYAVLSYDYWARRFGKEPKAIGRTFRMGNTLFEIVGVVAAPFTGTEPGTVTDIFVPAMMHAGVSLPAMVWHRTLARLKPGVAPEPVRARLHAASRAFDEELVKGFAGMTKERMNAILDQKVLLEPAAAGISGLRKSYRLPLAALAVLVVLVLLIACANVANLMAAQAAARAREMALRVSIGAGRWRLVQLVLVESAILACLAAAIGGLFAWWSAPFIVGRINPPDNPARLFLPLDWRMLGFGLALTFGVALLFGTGSALRASAVKPVHALKGGESPHSRRHLMHVLIATQAAFCLLVLFIAGLFVTTFDRLSNRPAGFSAERILILDAVAQRPVARVLWSQVAEFLRTVPGVAETALAGWPLLGGGSWNGSVSIDGGRPGPVLAYFLHVSPGWLDVMKIGLIGGRDLDTNDTSPGIALVNETFARQFFKGESPIGRTFETGRDRYQVVGLVRDTPYRSMREPILPVAYVPFSSVDAKGASQTTDRGAFLVRTSGANPLALAQTLRREVPRAQPGFRVSNVRTQVELVRAQTVRERLLAMLSLFFAVVALLLAGIGFYGVLNYSVLQRRREIGIRRAVGAQAGDIARRVTVDVVSMVLVGAAAGLALGMASVRYIETLLYEVKATEVGVLALPSLAILAAAVLAALPGVIRAVRIDPVQILRSE